MRPRGGVPGPEGTLFGEGLRTGPGCAGHPDTFVRPLVFAEHGGGGGVRPQENAARNFYQQFYQKHTVAYIFLWRRYPLY